MATKTCPQCQGSGNTIGVKSGGILFENTKRNCPECWGTGTIQVNDPPPSKRKSKAGTTTGSNTTTESDSEQQARGALAFMGFLAGSIFSYNQLFGDLIWAGITGLVFCWIAWRWYKAIIIIGLIAGLFYLIS